MSNLSGFIKRLRDIMRNDAGINGDAQRIEQIAWMLFLKVYDAKEQDWMWDDEGYESILPEPCRWANWARDDKSGNALTGDQLLNFVNNGLWTTPADLGLGWNGEAFGTGKAVIMKEGNWVYGTLQKDYSDINFGVKAMPSYKGVEASMSFTVGYASSPVPRTRSWPRSGSSTPAAWRA